MLGMARWQELFCWISGVVETIVLLLKLGATRLYRVYRCFGLYLLYSVFCSLLLLAIRRGTNAYAVAWACTIPMKWFLTVLVLFELFSLVTARFPGVGTLMKWAPAVGFTIAIGSSLLMLSLDFRNSNDPFPILRAALAVRRVVDSTIGISVFLPLLFMIGFPIPLSHNTVLHCCLLAAFYGGEAIELLLRNMLGAPYAQVMSLGGLNTPRICVSCAGSSS